LSGRVADDVSDDALRRAVGLDQVRGSAVSSGGCHLGRRGLTATVDRQDFATDVPGQLTTVVACLRQVAFYEQTQKTLPVRPMGVDTQYLLGESSINQSINQFDLNQTVRQL